MSEETSTAETTGETEMHDTPDAAKADALSDDFVDARFTVAVIPNESVSAHFQVAPKDGKNAIQSVTVSFVEQKDGMVVHSFAGSTVQELVEPRAGQGAAGDSGVDVAVFAGQDTEGDMHAILAGTVRTEDGPQQFYFSRPFYL